MRLSVIIPCYNAASTIEAQLKALANQDWSEPWEVIVANNRSTDNSMEIVEVFKGEIPNLRIVDASARQGQPYALNVGVEAARGDVVAFCDADDEVGKGWVAAMGEALSKYDFVASSVDTEKISESWVFAGLGMHPQAKGLNKIWYPPYLSHAGGGTLGVKRELHQLVDGFDESLPYLHDTDFCFKLQLAGVELHFVPDAVVHVRLRDTLCGIFHQADHFAEYNVKLYDKYRLLTGSEVPHPWRRYFRDWKKWMSRMSKTRSKKDLAPLAWSLGLQVGLLRGAVKYKSHPVPK